MTRRLTSLVLALALGLYAAQETDLEENCDVPLAMCFFVGFWGALLRCKGMKQPNLQKSTRVKYQLVPGM